MQGLLQLYTQIGDKLDTINILAIVLALAIGLFIISMFEEL